MIKRKAEGDLNESPKKRRVKQNTPADEPTTDILAQITPLMDLHVPVQKDGIKLKKVAYGNQQRHKHIGLAMNIYEHFSNAQLSKTRKLVNIDKKRAREMAEKIKVYNNLEALEKGFQCTLCKDARQHKVYPSYSGITRHIAIEHYNQLTYACSWEGCNFGYNQPRAICLHFILDHIFPKINIT